MVKSSKPIERAAFFKPIENTRPFLKLALEGFSGSGKSFTAGLIAVGLHDMIKSQKPIALLYTEQAGLGALERFYRLRKKDAVIRQERSLEVFKDSVIACERGESDILVIDSVTHLHQKFIVDYKRSVGRDYLRFDDWGRIKPAWTEQFSDIFLTAKVHIIFTGRAKWEWNMFEDEDGKKELEKTGVSMKVDSETEYEPDILMLMTKEQSYVKENIQIKRSALVLKDRTDTIDGRKFDMPTFNAFKPAIEICLTGTPKDEDLKEVDANFESRETRKNEYITNRNIALEKIKSAMVSVFPGQTKDEKQMKDDIVKVAFNTGSWTEIEKRLPLEKLTDGVELLELFAKKARAYIDECRESTVPVDANEVMNMLGFARDELNMPEKGGIEDAIKQDEIPFGEDNKNG